MDYNTRIINQIMEGSITQERVLAIMNKYSVAQLEEFMSDLSTRYEMFYSPFDTDKYYTRGADIHSELETLLAQKIKALGPQEEPVMSIADIEHEISWKTEGLARLEASLKKGGISSPMMERIMAESVYRARAELDILHAELKALKGGSDE